MRSTLQTRAQDRLLMLRLALLAGSLAAITYGIACGELRVVLAKGIRICLECIGIA